MNHLETTYKTPDGKSLFLQAWMAEKAHASLLVIHGLGEHSGRYSEFAQRLNTLGISVFSFDGRGHGKSAENEPDAYFESYSDYLKDIHALLGKVKTYSPGIPTFLYGHSMGGGLAAAYVIKYKPELSGVILSSPAIMEDPNTSKILLALSGFVSNNFPKLKVLKLDPSKISRSSEEVERYLNDPLIYTKAYPARTARELIEMMKFIQKQAAEIKLPVLLLHGSDDTLTNPEGSKLIYNLAESKDKTLKILPGGYHELINDLDKEKVYLMIEHWLTVRI